MPILYAITWRIKFTRGVIPVLTNWGYVSFVQNDWNYINRICSYIAIISDDPEPRVTRQSIKTMFLTYDTPKINPLITENYWRYNQALVSIVAADALVLKHQGINTHNTDSPLVASNRHHKNGSFYCQQA